MTPPVTPLCQCCQEEREKKKLAPLPLKEMPLELITEAVDEKDEPLFRHHDLPYYLCVECDAETLAIIDGR